MYSPQIISSCGKTRAFLRKAKRALVQKPVSLRPLHDYNYVDFYDSKTAEMQCMRYDQKILENQSVPKDIHCAVFGNP